MHSRLLCPCDNSPAGVLAALQGHAGCCSGSPGRQTGRTVESDVLYHSALRFVMFALRGLANMRLGFHLVVLPDMSTPRIEWIAT